MKSEIRAQILELRNNLSKQETEEKSSIIANKLFDSKYFQEATKILLYSSKGNEVDTKIIIKNSVDNKNIVLPRTNVAKGVLDLYQIKSLEDLEEGAFGLQEPKENLNKVEPEEIDLAIIPGVAFDKKGNRIGYGLGFYDKLLSSINAKKIGLSYEIQIVENIEAEEHDIKADMILTEKRGIDCEGI